MVVSLDVVFRSYVAAKAWKKALAHFDELSPEQFAATVADAVVALATDDASVDFLTAESGEDGFGLLRRNITRVLEGLRLVLKCSEYQFWEERHVVNADVHTKLRLKLVKQVREALALASPELSRNEIDAMLLQDALLREHSRTAEEHVRIQQREEKERREAEKRSVREAARKLLEIELKAQEDEKEAQRREKEERKHALMEARLEAMRQKEAQKEAKKEALRLAKEEERRQREELKEMKQALKEEEKRKRAEEKENVMKRRIEELRERRKMREEQKAILENGVVTTTDAAGGAGDAGRDATVRSRDGAIASGDSAQRVKSASGASPSAARAHAAAVRKQQLALLKFVDDEKDRRRKLRLQNKKLSVEKAIWTSVKAAYLAKTTAADDSTESSAAATALAPAIKSSSSSSGQNDDAKLEDVVSPVSELGAIPTECQRDVLFAWDFVAAFADVLRLTAVPSLSTFVQILTLRDGSSAVGDGKCDDEALGRVFAGFHAELVRALLAEYFPMLQTGTRLDEFYRTRPLNVFTWPELARQVCVLALELRHPSVDDHVLKTLKGSKSSRDDAAMLPLRTRLQKRGVDLLNGVPYQESSAAESASDGQAQSAAVARPSDAGAAVSSSSTAASKFYGVVLANGIRSKLTLEEKDGHLVVAHVHASPTDASESDATPASGDDNAANVHVGDFLVSVNGVNVKGMTLSAFNAALADLPSPHGLLLSSTPPPVKAPMRHIATTLNSSKLKRCAHVLKLLRAKEIAGPFNQPVDADLYPDYYSSGVITEPMDLGTIAEKLEDEDYEHDDVESFVDDVALVWKNCFTYNSVKAEISHLAKKLAAIFERLMAEWVYSDVNRHLVSSEEDHCRSCQTNSVRDRLLLCDRCDAAYHTFCLSTPLTKIPTGEWFCPVCVRDPAFSPDQFKRKSGDAAGAGADRSGDATDVDVAYSGFEKRVVAAIDVLARENYSDVALSDRIRVLRVLCELLQGTSAVQSVYQSIESKAIDARRDYGDALADLTREWDAFAPPPPSQAVDRTSKFIIDGVEHELTDELLDYLKDKARAELDGRPIPPLPASAIERLHKQQQQHGAQSIDMRQQLLVLQSEMADETSDDSDSEATDELELLESFGDQFLAEATAPQSGDGDALPADAAAVCAFCGLEDGILNGALLHCKRCPLTSYVSPLDHFDVPDLLSDDTLAPVLSARWLSPQDCASVQLMDTQEGVQLNGVFSETDAPCAGTIYAINDVVVHGAKSSDILAMVRRAEQPILVYVTSLPGDVLRASVSIIKLHSLPIALALAASQSFVFVEGFERSRDVPVGFGELCQQILPGDVLVLVNDAATHGRDVADVQQLLVLEHARDVKYVAVMRAPCSKMKVAVESWRHASRDVATQRARTSAVRTAVLAALPAHVPTRKHVFDVQFYDGPLGLALSLESHGVTVKSLNDQPNGALGQASLSRQIRCGDTVERVNGQPYGQLHDLGQFTSYLLGLPRPLVLTFSRDVPVDSASASSSLGFPHSAPSAGDAALMATLREPDVLCERLGVARSTPVKTVRVDHLPLPFAATEFVGSICVIATNGHVPCEPMAAHALSPLQVLTPGDVLVGVNGTRVAGVTWPALQSLFGELVARSPLYLHFASHAALAPETRVLAHKACAHAANLAWSECEALVPKIAAARAFEHFVNWSVVPRTLPLGRCRTGYAFFRFFSDRYRLYVQSSASQWFVCATTASVTRVLQYLEQDERDRAIAARVRATFHHLVHGKTAAAAAAASQRGSAASQQCCEHAETPFLLSGPFAVKTDIIVSVSEFDVERFDAMISYGGRKYLVGEFSVRQHADTALHRAEALVRVRGSHLVADMDVTGTIGVRFPTLPTPVMKAEAHVKRVLSRKYEYAGGVLDASGKPKAVPLSQSVYHVLRRGLRSEYAPTSAPVAVAAAPYSGHPPHQVSPNAAAMQEQLKRKHAALMNRDAALQANEQLKRAKFGGESGAPLKKSPMLSGASHIGAGGNRSYHPMSAAAEPSTALFKRSLQPLVDQGRAMLAAWNQFAVAPTVQTSSGLAFTCLSSFEEVKKAVSRVLVDPNGVHPDPKTFVCLHHAFVVGLICAMATQSLTNSRKTNGDSAFVKQIADAFATAILSCMDPSSMLRARALSGFAAVASQCEMLARPADLSDGLHHVANFTLQFFRTTQYLADGNFDDTSSCRPLLSPQSRGVETLPASFLQQVKLLENIREAYVRKMSATAPAPPSLRSPMPAAAPSSYNLPPPLPPAPRVQLPSTTAFPQSGSSGTSTGNGGNNSSNVPENGKDVYVNVAFGPGPLGIVINYSNRGTIIVTEFSGDSGMMGQAQASGKIAIGDEVFSVNGMYLESIGMEGFKATVASSGRPLQVTFRRFVSSPSLPPANESMNMPMPPLNDSGMGLRRQPASVFDYAPVDSSASGAPQPTPFSNNSAAMAPSPAPYAPSQLGPGASNDSYYGASNTTGVDSIGVHQQQQQQQTGLYRAPAPSAYPSVADTLAPFPFDSSGSNASGSAGSMANNSAPYGMPSSATTSPYIGGMPGLYASPASNGGLAPLPGLYDESSGSSLQVNQWQDPSPAPMRAYGQDRGLSSGYGDVGDNSGMSMGSLNVQQQQSYGMPSGYGSQDQRMLAPLPSMPQLASNASFNSSSGNNGGGGEYSGFVAPNDPNLAHDDGGQLSYYDANGTTYRSGFDFVLAPPPSTDDDGVSAHGDGAASTMSDAETELASPSVSQMTTPAQSDTEGDDAQTQAQAQRERRQADMMRLNAIASAVQSAASTNAPAAVPAAAQPAAGDDDASETVQGRRSSRVPKKITSNIADMYHPDFGKSSAAAAASASALQAPTDGDVGELATELLEPFASTIRHLPSGVPHALMLLKAQLLTIEAATPRDAFRAGRWGRAIRAAWAEMVFGADAAATVLEATLFLESNLESEWLDSCWKASPLQSARAALSGATLASTAMRIFALDDAIAYVRVKRATKRRGRPPAASASTSPTRQTTSALDSYASAPTVPTHPSQLPFMSRFTPATIDIANRMVQRICVGQRDKTMSAYVVRKVRLLCVSDSGQLFPDHPITHSSLL